MNNLNSASSFNLICVASVIIINPSMIFGDNPTGFHERSLSINHLLVDVSCPVGIFNAAEADNVRWSKVCKQYIMLG